MNFDWFDFDSFLLGGYALTLLISFSPRHKVELANMVRPKGLFILWGFVCIVMSINATEHLLEGETAQAVSGLGLVLLFLRARWLSVWVKKREAQIGEKYFLKPQKPASTSD